MILHTHISFVKMGGGASLFEANTKQKHIHLNNKKKTLSKRMDNCTPIGIGTLHKCTSINEEHA